MDKKEFLNELEERLIGVSKEDKEEILQDYEEHFKIGKKKKRTEEEISKSLGEPKEIARQIRWELSGKKEGEELKTEAIETWVALKKFSKYLFNETKEKIDEIQENFNPKKISHWVWLALGFVLFMILISVGGGFFAFIALLILIIIGIDFFERKKLYPKTKNKIKKHKKEHKKKSTLKIIFALLFNILIFIWVWLAFFFVIIAFIIVGVIMVLSGILLIVYSIFSLINYPNPLLKDILFAGLFAGAGVAILGVLFTNLFDKVIQTYFMITKKYLRLNQRLIKK